MEVNEASNRKPRKSQGDPLKPRKLRSFTARHPSKNALKRALAPFSAFAFPPAVCSLAGFGGRMPPAGSGH